MLEPLEEPRQHGSTWQKTPINNDNRDFLPRDFVVLRSLFLQKCIEVRKVEVHDLEKSVMILTKEIINLHSCFCRSCQKASFATHKLPKKICSETGNFWDFKKTCWIFVLPPSVRHIHTSVSAIWKCRCFAMLLQSWSKKLQTDDFVGLTLP